MFCVRPFCRTTSRAAVAVAALMLLTPASTLPVRAQGAPGGQQATLSANVKSDTAKSDTTKSTETTQSSDAASSTTGAGTIAAVDQANPSQQKSLTTKAIE